MFETPAAKRVKRSELLENLEGVGTDLQKDDASADENSVPNYGFEYEFVESTIAPPVLENAKEESFQFNLFKAPSKAQVQTGKSEPETEIEDLPSAPNAAKAQPVLISIRSPTPEFSGEAAEGGLSRSRPDTFYFTASISSSTLRLRQEYAEAATTGEIVVSDSLRAWKGTDLSWRVLNLPAHPKQIVEDRTAEAEQWSSKNAGESTATVNGSAAVNHAQRRPRPSKKRRDLLRRKANHRQTIIDATKTKEEHEKEKRNKKNRERKLKRRAKERKEKEEAKGAVIETEASD